MEFHLGRPGRRRLTGGAVLLTALSLAACSDPQGSPAPSPTASPTPTVTALPDYDTTGIAVPRGDFCGLVDAGAVESALGAAPARSTTWGNGERAELEGTSGSSVRDVAHEFGCRWSTSTGEAAAWVFAPPVTRAQARRFVRLSDTRGCRTPDAPAFGRPSVTVVCESRDGDTTVSLRGLFVDAWFTCELSGRDVGRAAMIERAGAWCVQVLDGVRTD